MGKVRRGQPFVPSARDWNRFIDVANAFDRGKFETMPSRASFGETVLAKNSSGSDVVRGGVLGINGLVFSRSDNEQDFEANNIAIDGTTPVVATHTGRFVIAAEPIANGLIGRVYASGICPAKLDVNATWHDFADVKASLAELDSKPGGGVQILWQESGTGSGKWAIVRFGPMPSVVCEFSLSAALATTDASKGATITKCTIPDYDTETITVYNHPATSNYIFEGDSGDDGTAYYDAVSDKWFIVQMECP